MYKAGDKVSRKPEALCSGGWRHGGMVLTVETALGDSLTFKEVFGTWDSTRFALEPAQGQVVGRKDDSGKLDMTLLDDMPRAVASIVEVMQWAVTEKQPTPYTRGSWLGVHADRYRAAIKRHDRDAAQQASVSNKPVRFERDKETNLLHLAHVACSAMMALENALRELEQESNAHV
jgi:hypothetical protein